MGRKWGLFSAVKRLALSSESNKGQKPQKSKKRWLWRQRDAEPDSLSEKTAVIPPPPPPPPLPIKHIKLTEEENEQSTHAYSLVVAAAAAAKAAVAAAQAAAEVVRLTSAARSPGKSKEEIAAIKIQTAFRRYKARRALRTLRGSVRLKSLIRAKAIKRQASSALQCMQTLARVQSQIRARRIRMSEENQALQRQLQQKHEKELEKLRASVGDWNHSTKSKEQMEAKQASRQEAAMRRERALAYAFNHQQTWKNSSKSQNPPFMDPNNPHWGWSWLERWMSARPWEKRNLTYNYDHGSAKSEASRSTSVHRDINHPTPQKSSRPPSCHSPPTASSKAPSVSSTTSKLKSPSLRVSCWGGEYDDSRSMLRVQSERYRRHSISGSFVRDDDSPTGSPAVSSYIMVPTRAKSAKTHSPSPLGIEKNRTLEKGLQASARKQLSFSASPAGARGHSVPPKV
ncbi:hypothetical protein SLA2020_421910 [Shorea laevis]